MRGLRAAGLVTLATLVVLGGSAQALPAAEGNAAATLGYVRAQYRYQRAIRAHIAASAAATNAFVGNVGRRCPRVLAHAPKRGHEIVDMRGVIVLSVLFAFYEPDRAAVRRTTNAIAHLRWSDSNLQRLVRARVRMARLSYGTRPLRLCKDASAWVASGYRALPHEVTVFVKKVKRSVHGELQREARLRRLLSRYEGSAAKSLSERLFTLSMRVQRRSLNTYGPAGERLLSAMAVPPENG